MSPPDINIWGDENKHCCAKELEPLNPKQLAIIQAVADAERRALPNCSKCARVLAVAAANLGISTPEIERRLFSELDANLSEIEDLYAVLIALVSDGRYLEGQGNMGSAEVSPANPLFTECWLTPDGRNVVGG